MSQATLGTEPFQNSNLFSSYYLSDRIDDLDDWECDAAAEDAFERLGNLWELEHDLVEGYKEDGLLKSWIDKVVEVLGFDSLPETTLPDGGGYTDRLLYETADTRREAAKRKKSGDQEAAFGLASVVLEAKQWDADFTTKFDEQRSYRDASHQIKYYLERTPERLQWGILTNGRKWRLYGTKDYATEIYYEVDLPELLESGDLERFKYFFAFFRREAFREVGGTSFLDTVWSESETAAQQLGEDLQDNVFTALRVLGEGFIETNDLDIDPSDAEAREELKEQSLVLLYRLMFILYAESRGLIHPDDPAKQVEYEEHFSLEQRLLDVHEDITSGGSYEDFSGYSTQLWGRLQDLFDLIDEGEEDLGIPPYNGGLFDDETHEFLAENGVSDRYLAEVIHRLGTTEGEEGRPVIADYADLDTRHLGSIYEGLLEHEFRIAPEQYAAVSEDGGQVWKPATEVSFAAAVESVDEGGLYVVNDDGERKATGAYYTPDYVVSYIVEETIDPLIEEIKDELGREGLLPGDMGYFGGFYSRVLQLKVLDPAMGSAHFLTSATAYLTEQVMEVAREQEQGRDEQEIRRTIAKECIYGVDINGMAVELGKLSMWLETLAADKPLAFLDHHLKAGNSLVGSDITDVLSDDSEDTGGQLTLSQSFARARQQTLGHVMDLMSDLLAIDNDGLADIKSMEELYDEIRDDPLYRRLFEVANVHTAEQFGVDVPEGVYEDMAMAIDDSVKWAEIQEKDWFKSAQSIASEQSFFHWELEYPEVFFNEDGEKLDGAGFDAVIGNPPYVRQEQLNDVKEYLQYEYFSYESAADLYTYFIERSHEILIQDGSLGVIVSNKFIHAEYGSNLRQYLSSSQIRRTIDFHSLPVFGPDVSAYPLILVIDKSDSNPDKELLSARIPRLDFQNIKNALDEHGYHIKQRSFVENGWRIQDPQIIKAINKIELDSTELVDYLDVSLRRGILTGLNEAFIIDENKREEFDSDFEHIHSMLKGKDVDRYRISYNDRYLIAIPSGWTMDISGTESEEKAWEWFQSEHTKMAEYLSQFKTDAMDRHDRGECWWELRPCDYYDELSGTKVLYPVISRGPNFTMDLDGNFINDKLYSIPKEDYYLLGVLNSSLTHFWVKAELSGLRGGYQEFRAVHVEQVPINKSLTDFPKLEKYAKQAIDLRNKYDQLNLSLLDHLGAYSDGPTLADIGLAQPPSGSANSILQETAEEKPNLRVGEASVGRESDNTVEIRLTARYKPSEDDDLDESEFETDQWGYTETGPQAALRITDLTPTEADLIEAFVPVAVDEAGGFAGFRETATKTNSLVDRLRKLTLPRVADVEAGLESYVQTVERANELEDKIQRTDALIDQIVYELYGLTDEEIEIVEEAVGE